MIRRLQVAALLALTVPGPACAAALPDFIKNQIGEWLVATDDGKPGCRIVLKGEKVKAAWLAVPAPDCGARLPQVAKATAWDFESGVRLFDGAGKLLMEFAEDETTMMKTRWERPPVAFLVKARPGAERAPFAPDLLGTWTIRRPGGPSLCEVTFAKGPKKDGEDTFVLTAGTPCDPALRRLRLNSWRVEDFTLMLDGEPETSLRFEPGPDGFVKAEADRPLEMVRAAGKDVRP